MEMIEKAVDARDACESARADGLDVGFVPTMGYLHDGHLSLLRKAREEADFVVASIFVNPLQFGDGEDLDAYPRDGVNDSFQAEAEGVDLLFTPAVEEMYPDGYPPPMTIDPGPDGDRFEGASRSGHFRGVLTVVTRLVDLVGHSRAYFGEKDAQQLFLVRRMANELAIPVEIVSCPTVREADGLAMSSRNAYLSPPEREAAVCLFRALSAARDLYADGERNSARIQDEMSRQIGAEPLATIDYSAVVDPATFDLADPAPDPALALVAARIGRTRLIDNLPLPPGV